MTEQHAEKNDHASVLRRAIRDVRARYDQLERGKTAPIRRARTADDVALEGAYWRIGGTLAREERHLAHVVLLFPCARHATKESFSFGRYLRRQIVENDGATLRFRRVLDSHDREELDHRLRGMLKLAGADTSPVDWGVLGTDMLWFFAESDGVRRRWAQDFYAPTAREPSAAGSAPSATTTSPT